MLALQSYIAKITLSGLTALIMLINVPQLYAVFIFIFLEKNDA